MVLSTGVILKVNNFAKMTFILDGEMQHYQDMNLMTPAYVHQVILQPSKMEMVWIAYEPTHLNWWFELCVGVNSFILPNPVFAPGWWTRVGWKRKSSEGSSWIVPMFVYFLKMTCWKRQKVILSQRHHRQTNPNPTGMRLLNPILWIIDNKSWLRKWIQS